jgi:hypothetical protein
VTPYFGISRVRYDHNHTHIDRVVKHLINEVGIFDGRMASRYEIVDNLYNEGPRYSLFLETSRCSVLYPIFRLKFFELCYIA